MLAQHTFVVIQWLSRVSLRPHGLQYARLPCPSLSPEFAQIHVHWVSDGYLTISSSASLIFFVISLSEHQGLFQGVVSSHLHSYSIAKFNDVGEKGAMIPETALLQGMTSEPFNSWFIFTQLLWLTFPSLFQCRCLTPLVSSFCDLSSIPNHYGFLLKNSLFFLELPDVSYRNVCRMFFINYPISHLSFQRQLIFLTNTNIKNKMRDPWKAWVQSDT